MVFCAVGLTPYCELISAKKNELEGCGNSLKNPRELNNVLVGWHYCCISFLV